MPHLLSVSWSGGRGVLWWLRRNDPLGGTVKGVIVLFFGALVAVKGAWWVGLAVVVLGAGLFVMPIWLHRRDQRGTASMAAAADAVAGVDWRGDSAQCHGEAA